MGKPWGKRCFFSYYPGFLDVLTKEMAMCNVLV